jgi:hypothetical protein
MCIACFNIAGMHSQYTVTVVRLRTILSSYCFYCFSRGHGLCFTVWYGLYFCAQFRRMSVLRLVACLSPLESRFVPRTIHVRFVVFKRALGQVCLPVLRISCHYHSTNAPYSSPSTCCSYQNGKQTSLETLQKAMLFRKSGSIG